MDNYGESMGSGFLAGVGIVGGIIYLAIIVLMIAGLWKMFEKAGKPGWAAIIPIYNMIVMLEIVGKPLWWIIGLFVPCINIVVLVWVTNLLMKSFGKDTVYTILALFFPFIIYPMLGFGDARYIGPTAAEARGQDSFNQFREYKNPFDNKGSNSTDGNSSNTPNDTPTDPTV